MADLEAAIERYALLTGDDAPFIVEVPDQKVRVAVFSGGAIDPAAVGGRIELVAATAPDSPITKFLASRGEGLHHICLYVENIDQKLAELRKAGVRLIDESPRIGAEGHRIAFVHPSGCGGVLVELEERVKRTGS